MCISRFLVQRSQSFHNHHISSTARSTTMSSSTRAMSSSAGVSDISSLTQSIDYHEIYERIAPYVRETVEQLIVIEIYIRSFRFVIIIIESKVNY